MIILEAGSLNGTLLDKSVPFYDPDIANRTVYILLAKQTF